MCTRGCSDRLVMSLLVLLAGFLPMAVLGGGTATVQTGDGTAQFYWSDDGFRIGGTDAADYMIIRDGKGYSVSTGYGQPRVFALNVSNSDDGQEDESVFDSVDSIEATGGGETVAGIEGQVYRMTTTDSDGKTETMKVVLTSNPLVMEMTQAYMRAIQTLAGRKDDAFMAALPGGRSGLLRVEDDYRVTSISGAEPAASLFVLPAKPKSLADMMQDLRERMPQ